MYNRQAASEPASQPSATGSDVTPVAAAETDTVSLHGATATQPTTAPQDSGSGQAPEVFAEIWKDGMKVGTVYTNGEAALPAALAGMTVGSGGTTYAYMRAEEISRQVGGEVRFVNISALQVAQTRAQLRAAYAA